MLTQGIKIFNKGTIKEIRLEPILINKQNDKEIYKNLINFSDSFVYEINEMIKAINIRIKFNIPNVV